MLLKGKKANLITGILSILIGATILFLTKIQGLEMVKSNRMGPGFFPTVCGIGIVLCGVLMLLELSKSIKAAATDDEAAQEMEKEVLDIRELKNLGLFGVLGIGVLLLSEYLGMLICLGLCVLIYLKVQGKESWKKAIIISLCMMAFLYVIFVMFLHVPVPKGPLGF